ncbi:MAG: hypothetical protein J0I34_14620 [Pseudonocardia sp.]|uniref:hypothetical protein n=1 Tax=unclassified Pseudonocardia TaxID=2619320 RepID=UPI00086863D9|nr:MULTISPECIES: hypothetical protein [unclassified Pseudonocardia]MBN9110007.1 hypothetical protein [Pseudonocardia sp.]ODV03319.1 MAG: hypothetical protein ABT15_23325 [Pseudonocardia sp. SCN 73-27]
MADGPASLTGRHIRRAPSGARTLLPADVADLLLDGDPSPHPVTSILAAARRPGTAHELRGEAAARQAFVDALPLATPVPMPDARDRRGRHRRMRAVRTVVTAKVVGVAALTLTAGGVAVAATGPSGAPAEERISDGVVPSAGAEPGTGTSAPGRAPGTAHTGSAQGRTAACGPVTGAAIADLARDCGDPGRPAEQPGEQRVGPGATAFGSPYVDVPQEAPTGSAPGTTMSAPPTTAPSTTAPPTTTPPPPRDDAGSGGSGGGSGSPAAGTPDSDAGSGSSGPGSSGSGGHGPGRGHSPGDAAPRRDESATKPGSAGETRAPVTGRAAPPTP